MCSEHERWRGILLTPPRLGAVLPWIAEKSMPILKQNALHNSDSITPALYYNTT